MGIEKKKTFIGKEERKLSDGQILAPSNHNFGVFKLFFKKKTQ